jgi:hypothetical protein
VPDAAWLPTVEWRLGAPVWVVGRSAADRACRRSVERVELEVAVASLASCSRGRAGRCAVAIAVVDVAPRRWRGPAGWCCRSSTAAARVADDPVPDAVWRTLATVAPLRGRRPRACPSSTRRGGGAVRPHARLVRGGLARTGRVRHSGRCRLEDRARDRRRAHPAPRTLVWRPTRQRARQGRRCGAIDRGTAHVPPPRLCDPPPRAQPTDHHPRPLPPSATGRRAVHVQYLASPPTTPAVRVGEMIATATPPCPASAHGAPACSPRRKRPRPPRTPGRARPREPSRPELHRPRPCARRRQEQPAEAREVRRSLPRYRTCASAPLILPPGRALADHLATARGDSYGTRRTAPVCALVARAA